MKREITREEFRQILPSICDRETSADPDHWTADNPLWGHCAVVSVLAQNFFGGQVTAAYIEKPEKFHGATRHYRNMSDAGEILDFTADQFGKDTPSLVREKRVTNSLVYVRIKKSRRYKLLLRRFVQAWKKC